MIRVLPTVCLLIASLQKQMGLVLQMTVSMAMAMRLKVPRLGSLTLHFIDNLNFFAIKL